MSSNSNLLSRIDERTRLAGHNRLAMLLFSLGGKSKFGINVFKVLEVVRKPPLFRVPGLADAFAGVADMRGRCFPVIDLPKLLKLPDGDEDPGYLIVTEFNQQVQGFLVSAVEKIVNVEVREIQPPNQVGGGSGWLTGLVRIQQQLVQILDVESIMASARGVAVIHDASILAPDRPQGKVFRALVVDDSRTAQNQIKEVLDQLQVQYTIFSDGQQAYDHLRTLAEAGTEVHTHYAMMISDVEMPVMDGYTLTRQVRQDPRMRGLHIILHSSLSGVFHQARVEQVEADAFVAKYSPKSLADKVQERLMQLM